MIVADIIREEPKPPLHTDEEVRAAIAYAARTPSFGQGIPQAVALVDRWAREARPS